MMSPGKCVLLRNPSFTSHLGPRLQQINQLYTLFEPVTSNIAVQLDLRIACATLRNRDFGSKSDPFCVLLEKDTSGVWKELGRTEVVKNSHGVPSQFLWPCTLQASYGTSRFGQKICVSNHRYRRNCHHSRGKSAYQCRFAFSPLQNSRKT
jgi:hypothetical protein